MTQRTCEVEGCIKPWRKPLTRLRVTRRSTLRDEDGKKICSVCERWLVVDEFYPVAKAKDGRASYCRRCDRNNRLVRNYGLTVDQYEEMLESQGGGCAICRGLPKDSPSLHVDHDHACCPGRKKSCGRCIRGLLCEDCNRVLGMFADDPARFVSAIAYLERHRG